MTDVLAEKTDKDTIKLKFVEDNVELEVYRGFRLIPTMTDEYLGIKVRFADKWGDVMSWRKILSCLPIGSVDFTKGNGRLWFYAYRYVLEQLCHDLLNFEADSFCCQIELKSSSVTARCKAINVSHSTTLEAFVKPVQDPREALV